jgi:hypothetical protein
MRKVAGQIPDNPESIVSEIVKTLTNLNVTAYEQIKGRGMSNAVTIASTAEGRLVVRTNVLSHLSRFQREAWILGKLHHNNVLVPECLGCGVLGEYSYSVARYIEGSEVISPAMDNLRVWRKLGSYARCLNAITEQQLNEEPQASAFFSCRWKEQASDDVSLIFKDDFWIKHKELTEQQNNRLREYLDVSIGRVALMGVCQFDISTGNALIKNSDYEQIYMIDFEFTNIAPVPEYQLACIAAGHGPTSEIMKSFCEGYGLSDKELLQLSPELDRLILHRVMRATAWARDRCPSLIQMNIERSRPIINHVMNTYLI